MPRTRARPRVDRDAAYAQVAEIIAEDAAPTPAFNRVPAIGMLIAVILLGIAAFGAWSTIRESGTELRGTVFERTHVPAKTIGYSDGYVGPSTQDFRERHVLRLRVEGEFRPRSYDVPKSFWEKVKPNDRVRRENGTWHVEVPDR